MPIWTSLKKGKLTINGYPSIGILIIDLMLYSAYYRTQLGFNREDVAFLFTLFPKETLFPAEGFLLIPIPAIASYIILIAGRNASNVVGILIIRLVAILVGLVVSLIFLPLSLTIFHGFASLLIATTIITFFRNLPPLYLEFKENNQDYEKNPPIKAIELEHARWISLLSQSIWLTVTLVAGLTSATILMLSEFVKLYPPVSENPHIWEWLRLQTFYFVVVISYFALGLIAGGISYCNATIRNIELELYRLLGDGKSD